MAYLDRTEGTKRVRVSVGRDAQDAADACKRQTAELNAKGHGISVVAEEGRTTIAAAKADYLDEIKLTKKSKTLAAYTTSLDYFTESCRKMHLSDIERKDMLKFHAFLRDEKEQSPRTCWNKFSNVMSFLKANGISKLVKKNDWPQFVEEEPEIYERDELDQLFGACGEEELVWFSFYLMTGEREQEVQHSYWTDINLKANTVRVTHKPDLNWTPKAYKERSIPIPRKLTELLEAQATRNEGVYRPAAPNCVKTIQNIFFLHGDLRVQKVELALQQGESQSLNSDRKESSSIWLSGATQ